MTGGINWKADYVAVLNAADTQTDLTGWVTIRNRSGATYQNAQLKLVAGDVHRVREEKIAPRAASKMAAQEAAPQFKEESFFEYHLYTLDRRTTVKDNQTKQMTLLQADQVPIKKLFLFSEARSIITTGMTRKRANRRWGCFWNSRTPREIV